jgi:phytoene dehydrogenase-like protein
MQRAEADVLIVGAGLAGLACARHLQKHNVSFRILEASDAVGGRVRTDHVDGFLLDRGFQVLLTAYPEANAVLDFGKLHVHNFLPGALIHTGTQVHRVADPFREPLAALESILAPIGSMDDRLRLLALRHTVRRASVDSIFSKPERTTLEAIQSYKFSPTIIASFLRPFLSGIFLDKELKTSSRMFEFVFKMFTHGNAALPANGMGAIATQLSDSLPGESLFLNTRVRSIENDTVTTEGGNALQARAIVVATEGPEAARLLPEIPVPASRGATTVYFAASKDPVGSPILVLNGSSSGLVNHLCVPSRIAPSYAPSGTSLISASIVGNIDLDDEKLLAAVRSQLTSWFGQQANSWKHLRTYRIIHALPSQNSPANAGTPVPARIRDRVYVCGDHLGNASIEGALVSGRRAGEAIIREIS